MTTTNFDDIPNEIFVYEIFGYLNERDLFSRFILLNSRMRDLVTDDSVFKILCKNRITYNHHNRVKKSFGRTTDELDRLSSLKIETLLQSYSSEAQKSSWKNVYLKIRSFVKFIPNKQFTVTLKKDPIYLQSCTPNEEVSYQNILIDLVVNRGIYLFEFIHYVKSDGKTSMDALLGCGTSNMKFSPKTGLEYIGSDDQTWGLWTTTSEFFHQRKWTPVLRNKRQRFNRVVSNGIGDPKNLMMMIDYESQENGKGVLWYGFGENIENFEMVCTELPVDGVIPIVVMHHEGECADVRLISDPVKPLVSSKDVAKNFRERNKNFQDKLKL